MVFKEVFCDACNQVIFVVEDGLTLHVKCMHLFISGDVKDYGMFSAWTIEEEGGEEAEDDKDLPGDTP